MTSLSRYLQENLFSGLSVAEAAQKAGIDPSLMSKILRGKTVPSVESVLRIAYVTGSDPARIFEAAGQGEMALLCRGIHWPVHQGDLQEQDLYSTRDADLHRRVQRLVELGFYEQVDAALKPMEAAWELLRPAFALFAKDTGAKAAALIAETPHRSADVLFRWNCPDSKAQQLVELKGLTGWKSYSYDSGQAKLTLYLNEPRNSVRKKAETMLSLWAASLLRLDSAASEGARR